LRVINSDAFRNCELIGINLSHTQLTTLGTNCFTGGFLSNPAATAEVYLPASWVNNDGSCFRQLTSNLYVQIGQENKDYINTADLIKNNATSWENMFHSNVVDGTKLDLHLTFYVDASLVNQFSTTF
jgi:hypothetical protein